MTSNRKIITALREANRTAWEPTLAFFDWAAKRPTTPKETNIEVLQKELKLSKSDMAELALGIEEALIGTKIVGRHGLKSRIKWLFTLESIAKVARSEADELTPASVGPMPSASGRPRRIKHAFQLRNGNDEIVTFELPSDLTRMEADRLAMFLRSIPFQQG